MHNAIEFVKRKGGIRLDSSLAKELIYAAGDQRHLPPGLLTRNGAQLDRVAHWLLEGHYLPPDDHGRPDEGRTVDYLASVIRKWSPGLSDLNYSLGGIANGGSKSVRNAGNRGTGIRKAKGR